MKPAPVNLPIIWRGCDWAPVIFRWKDADGDPIDLTLWTPFVETSDFDLHPIITDAFGGIAQLALTSDQTANLKLGVYPWDWIWQAQSSTPSEEIVTAGTDPDQPVTGDDGFIVTVGGGPGAFPVIRMPPLLAGKVEVKEPTTTP